MRDSAEASSNLRLARCTPMETNFWWAAKVDPDMQPHLVQQIDIRGAIDDRALERAFMEIVDRNDAFRTTFHVKRMPAPGSSGLKGQLFRCVRPHVGWQLKRLSLCACDEAKLAEFLAETIRIERASAFDPETGPLFQFTLIQISDESHTLLIAASHLIMDAWAFGILFQDLHTYYEHYLRSDDRPNMPLRPQASDYAAWYWQTVERAGYRERSLTYWANHLKPIGCGNQGLLRDRSYDEVPRHTFVPRWVEGTVAASESLLEFNRRHGLTRLTVPLAAYALSLCRFSSNRMFLITNVIHGRFNRKQEETIGLLSNAILTQIEVDPEQEVLGWLEAIQANNMAGLRHGIVSLSSVVQHLTESGKMPPVQMDRSMPKLLFNAFSVDGLRRDGNWLFEGLESKFSNAPSEAPSAFELSMNVRWESNRMKYRVGAWADLYDRSTVERMAFEYQAAIEGIIISSRRSVADVL
jgi:hypothetical protein